MLAGVAWAQHRGIGRVEIQIDGEPWRPATLAPTVSTDTWRQWSYRWTAAKGDHEVRVRATDNTGETQTGAVAPPDPDGATGYHFIVVQVE